MDDKNKKIFWEAEFESNGLTFNDFISEVKKVCKQLNTNFVELEKILDVDLKSGSTDLYHLESLTSCCLSSKDYKLYQEIKSLLDSFRHYMVGNFFDRTESEVSPWSHSYIRTNTTKLVYLMGTRGINTNSYSDLLIEKENILNNPIRSIGTGDAKMISQEQANKMYFLSIGSNPYTYKPDDSFAVEYCFWDILFDQWLAARFSSFLFKQTNNLAYKKWQQPQGINFVMDFLIGLQKKTDNFIYKTFPREFILKNEKDLEQYNSMIETKKTAGKQKGKTHRERGMELIKEYYSNHHPKDKKEVDLYVLNELVKEFGLPAKHSNTVRNWQNEYLKHHKS